MKQQWQRLEARIDALSLRERSVIFLLAALVLITLFRAAFLDPAYAKQKQALQRMGDDHAQIASIQAEIARKTELQGADPDKTARAKLQQLRQQAAQMRNALLGSQKSLVSPDKMPALLESILKQNRNLRLISLRTLPVSSLAEAAEKKGKEAGALPQGGESGMDAVFSHSVEITVEGSYFDIMDYLQQLEAMPWQVYWRKADFQVTDYPDAVMTLTLSTMSLDRKWLNL